MLGNLPKVPQLGFEPKPADQDSRPAWNPPPAPPPPASLLSPRQRGGCRGQVADLGRATRGEAAGGVFCSAAARKMGYSPPFPPRSSTCGGSRTCGRSASLETPSRRRRITRCSSVPTFLTSCTWTSGASTTTWQVSSSGSPGSVSPSSGPPDCTEKGAGAEPL